MNAHRLSLTHRARRTAIFALMILSPSLLLGGCVSTGGTGGSNAITGFDQITLAPGDSGTCESSPCTVFLRMPEGTGTFEVTSNSSGRIGEYPAGQTVKLGGFWSSQAFNIVGADVPKAYAYIPNQQ
jgi:hypothetical protein